MNEKRELFESIVRKHQCSFYPVVDFDPSSDHLLSMDFTAENKTLGPDIFSNTKLFCLWVDKGLGGGNARYGIGGYNELRSVYDRSPVFDPEKPGDEPRRLHLGVDIWGPAGTPVYAFADGWVHSFAFNDRFGDYGATLITRHECEGLSFFVLYGHLALKDIRDRKIGETIRGSVLAGHFGQPEENGHWPPHLHLQIILDLENRRGDFPGVCRFSEREHYLANCPDPDLILQMNRYL